MAGDSLSKSDYFDAALELMATGGIGAVTISALCYRLGVTKGSFYHHFESGTAFQLELLSFWEHDRVKQLMPFLEAMDPVDRLTALKLGAVEHQPRGGQRFEGVGSNGQGCSCFAGTRRP